LDHQQLESTISPRICVVGPKPWKRRPPAIMLLYDHAMRRVAARYDKFAANDLVFVKLASIRTWLRANEYGY
jgi:transposase